MDGVFMKKLLTIVIFGGLVLSVLQGTFLLRDKSFLASELIRLHVVANSDSAEDQELKHKVKDAVVDYLSPYMTKLSDPQTALKFLEEKTCDIRNICKKVLQACGVSDDVSVSVGKELFDTRHYETFSLPSGIYQTLRIQIGEGEGKNWWCVAFPTLCLPEVQSEFYHVAADAGFSEHLTDTIDHDGDYTIRFYLLDCLGELEKILFF